MPKLWKKTGRAKSNKGLEPVDLSKLTINRPTVIYFPGQLAQDVNQTEISKGINYVKGLFSDLACLPIVYSWSRPDRNTRITSDLSSLFYATACNRILDPGTLSSVRSLAKGLIMPLVSDAEGKPLPFDKAQKNLRKLTFFAHCVGTVDADELHDAAMKMMKKIGYKTEEAHKLLHEIVLVTVGPLSRPEKEDNRYTTISFVNYDDRIINRKEWALNPLHRLSSLHNNFSKASRSLKIKQLSDTSILVTATARGARQDRSKKIQEEVIDNVRLPRWSKKALNHLLEDYGVNADSKSSQLAGMAQNALINAVKRKETLKPSQLLETPAITLETEEKKVYQQRMSQALGV